MMKLVLTNNGLKRIKLQEIKLYAAVKGWACGIGSDVLNILMTDETIISDSVCRGSRNIEFVPGMSPDIFERRDNFLCPKLNCFCGHDISIPKAKNKKILDDFTEMVQGMSDEELDNIPHFNAAQGDSHVYAFGGLDFLRKRVTHIDWFIGKRCNFDCFYCSPTIHDNSSRFKNLSEYVDVYNYILSVIRKKSGDNVKLNFSFHGGEPTLNPNYLELIKMIKRDQSVVSDITTLTNFSRSIEYLLELHNYSNIVYSMHLAYISTKSLDKLRVFLEKIEGGSNNTFKVKIMLTPGSLEQVKMIVSKFESYLKYFEINLLHNKKDKVLLPYSEEELNYCLSI